MTTHELQQEILRLKKEKNVCILAHAYQSQAVLEVADYTGDSYGLSVQAAKTDAAGVIMCGVRFMAETCKILSPEKTVWLANPMAGCPMAEQLDLPALRALKAQYPGYTTVAYINTTSALKTECDVCVTSSSAVNICRALDADKILFIPDPNLGSYVAAQLPEKQFAFYHGGCPRHMVVSAADVARRAPHTRPRSCSFTRVPRRGRGAGRLCRLNDRHHGVCEKIRRAGVHHRHREQHRGASLLRLPGQELLPAGRAADLHEHEADHPARHLPLPVGHRRRADHPAG